MNLWIRSQDKKELRCNPKFGIDMVENDCYIVDRYSFEKGIILGKYATEKRALEVLDEIQAFIENNCIDDLPSHNNSPYHNSPYPITNTRNKVYQMPKE